MSSSCRRLHIQAAVFKPIHLTDKSPFNISSGGAQNQHSFSSDQTWCRTNGKKLRFLDQTLEVVRSYDDDESGSDGDSNTASNEVPIDHSPPTSALISARAQKRALSPGNGTGERPKSSGSFLSFQHPTLETAGAPALARQEHEPSPHSASSEHGQFLGTSFPRRDFSIDLLEAIGLVPDEGSYPLLNPQDQFSFHSSFTKLRRVEKERLLRHFVDNLGPAFDLFDHGLATELPERATAYSPLLDLILSVSAKHLYTVTGSTQFSEARLGACPTEIIKDLYGKNCIDVDDDSLAIAALLLRFCQNMETMEGESTERT